VVATDRHGLKAEKPVTLKRKPPKTDAGRSASGKP
jgi:hypothetical protein